MIDKKTTELKVAHISTIDMALHLLLLNQMGSLVEAGYEVVGISSSGQYVPAVKAAGIRHIPVPMTRNVNPIADLIALWRLYRVMRQERFTIVHCHTPKAELLGQMAARLAGVPVVVDTFRGIYYRPDMYSLWRRIFILMARIAASRADLVLSQSRENREMAIQEGICPAEKIKFLGNGIDVRRFDPATLPPQDIARKRAEVDLPLSAPVVGFVGRLVREKGLLELLAAAQIIREQVHNAHFLFVGPVDTHKPDAFTPDTAGEYGLAESCRFLGERHDMPALYALMDVFALPSHREGFPRSPMEASAMGVPCVVTDIPGCREAVEHGRNGLLVPLGDIPALAEAIVELLTDREKACRMALEGRRMALERFDEQSVFDTVKAEYARLLQAKGFSVPTPSIVPATTGQPLST